MIKRILAALTLVGAFSAFAGSVTVGTDSTVVVPAVGVSGSGLGTWAATNVHANGRYLSFGPSVAMCLVGGTSTTAAPVFTSTKDFTDGSITWRPVPRFNRSYLFVKNAGTNDCYFEPERPAATTSGFVLSAGSSVILEEFQGELSAIRAAGSGAVQTTDW